MEVPALPQAERPAEDSSKDNGRTGKDDPPISPKDSINYKSETVQDHPVDDQEKPKAKENVMEETQVTQTSAPLQQVTNKNGPNEARRHHSSSLPSVRNKDRPLIEWDILEDNEDKSRATATPSAATMPYKVAPALIDTAKAIWDRYGDIGINCSLQSMQFRSAIFALISKVVLEMNKVGYISLDRKTVKKWQDEVDDSEKSGWEVGWLKQRVEEVALNIDAAEILLEVKKKREGERAKLKEFDEEIQRYLTLARTFSRKAFELKGDKAQKAKALEGKVRVPKILAEAVETVSLWGTKPVGDGLLGATSSQP